MIDNSQPTIVIVNDDPAERHRACAILEKDGFAAYPYPGAKEAIEALRTGPVPDLIITDLYMSEIDGWCFCRLIRSKEFKELHDVPILVLSATYAGVDATAITTDLGANAFLSVPYKPERLRNYVRGLLKKRVPESATTVLIVEDEDNFGQALEHMFTARGYLTRWTQTFADGLRLYNQHEPEIVLIDYYLPDATGDRMLESIKHPDSLSVAIMMTQDPSPELASELIHKGADAYVRKPSEPGYVIEVAEKVRRGRALLRVEDILEERTQALRKSEERFRTLLETIPEPVIIHGADNLIRYVNARGADHLGYSVNEMVGRPLSDFLTPECAEVLEDHTRYVLESGSLLYETTYVSRDGTPFDAEVNQRRIEFDGEQVVLSVARDISERKQAEAVRAELESRLRQAQKMQAIGTLAGGIAHDFNNILSPILGYTDIAYNSLDEDSPLRNYLGEVLKASNRAKQLVQQILTFSHNVEQQFKPVEIHLIIKEALNLIRGVLPSTIEIHRDIDLGCGTVLADPTQIYQAVMNLCTNAHHAMRKNGGTLTVSLRTVEVSRSSPHRVGGVDLDEGKYVRLSVADTGHGIDPAVQERVFEPFFTTKGPGKGYGMGLATVHGIVKAVNGTIGVTSEPGKGTRFDLYIPQYGGPAEGKQPRTKPMSRGTESVLVVDDEEPIVRLIRSMLKQLGYRVSAYTNSSEALDAYRADPQAYDIVVIDQTMPKITGAELARELLETRPDLPIILVTGFSELFTYQDAKRIGIREYLMKPILPADLAESIRRCLDAEAPTNP